MPNDPALYRLGYLVVESDVPLPLARADGTGIPACTIRRDDRGPSESPSWMRRWTAGGKLTLSCAREGTRYLLRFHGYADFHVSADAAEIAYHAPRIGRARLGSLIVDDLMPVALSAMGRLVLHASAVLTDRGVIAFLGATGAGKSTLAAALATAGCTPLADDWLVVNVLDRRLAAIAGVPTWKLRPDSAEAVFGHPRGSASCSRANEKERIESHSGWAVGTEPMRIHRVYMLVPDDAPEGDVNIRPLSAREAFLALVCHSFGIDIDDTRQLRAHADRFATAAVAPVWCALRVPRTFASLAAVRQAIIPSSARPHDPLITHGVA